MEIRPRVGNFVNRTFNINFQLSENRRFNCILICFVLLRVLVMISSRDLWFELFWRMAIGSLIPICNMVRNLQHFLFEGEFTIFDCCLLIF
jgi:hypothetical protein